MYHNSDPKPEKREKKKMTSLEFRRLYNGIGKKKSKKLKSDYSRKVEEADKWFSRAVRLSGADSQGVGKCVSCGKIKEVKYMDCGHYYSRIHKSTRWSFLNARLQCKICNKNMGRPEINQAFKDALIKEGVDIEILEIKKNSIIKLTTFELDLIINECKQIVDEGLKSLGLKKW